MLDTFLKTKSLTVVFLECVGFLWHKMLEFKVTYKDMSEELLKYNKNLISSNLVKMSPSAKIPFVHLKTHTVIV